MIKDFIVDIPDARLVTLFTSDTLKIIRNITRSLGLGCITKFNDVMNFVVKQNRAVIQTILSKMQDGIEVCNSVNK